MNRNCANFYYKRVREAALISKFPNICKSYKPLNYTVLSKHFSEKADKSIRKGKRAAREELCQRDLRNERPEDAQTFAYPEVSQEPTTSRKAFQKAAADTETTQNYTSSLQSPRVAVPGPKTVLEAGDCSATAQDASTSSATAQDASTSSATAQEAGVDPETLGDLETVQEVSRDNAQAPSCRSAVSASDIWKFPIIDDPGTAHWHGKFFDPPLAVSGTGNDPWSSGKSVWAWDKNLLANESQSEGRAAVRGAANTSLPVDHVLRDEDNSFTKELSGFLDADEYLQEINSLEPLYLLSGDSVASTGAGVQENTQRGYSAESHSSKNFIATVDLNASMKPEEIVALQGLVPHLDKEVSSKPESIGIKSNESGASSFNVGSGTDILPYYSECAVNEKAQNRMMKSLLYRTPIESKTVPVDLARLSNLRTSPLAETKYISRMRTSLGYAFAITPDKVYKRSFSEGDVKSIHGEADEMVAIACKSVNIQLEATRNAEDMTTESIKINARAAENRDDLAACEIQENIKFYIDSSKVEAAKYREVSSEMLPERPEETLTGITIATEELSAGGDAVTTDAIGIAQQEEHSIAEAVSVELHNIVGAVTKVDLRKDGRPASATGAVREERDSDSVSEEIKEPVVSANEGNLSVAASSGEESANVAAASGEGSSASQVDPAEEEGTSGENFLDESLLDCIYSDPLCVGKIVEFTDEEISALYCALDYGEEKLQKNLEGLFYSLKCKRKPKERESVFDTSPEMHSLLKEFRRLVGIFTVLQEPEKRTVGVLCSYTSSLACRIDQKLFNKYYHLIDKKLSSVLPKKEFMIHSMFENAFDELRERYAALENDWGIEHHWSVDD